MTRRRGNWMVVLMVVLGVVSNATAASSPSALVASAMSAMRAQSSYHYVATQLGATSAAARVVIVGDASHSEGIQRITFSKRSRTGHVTALVVSNTAYVRGDAFTLSNYMGFPAASAAAYAGKWLSLPHTAPDFATVAADVRLDSSAADELKMPTTARVIGRSVIHGQHVIGIRATLHHSNLTAVETLYVRSSDHLPVEQHDTSSGKLLADVVFSEWGKPVHVSAPATAILLR